ncbi:MAG: hypothetical protein NZ927_00150 [Candidatus Calescibacterium sp.]|nr:hypothetical protein [Candidatus Calescibacterium sp.]MCX7734645.1 hypothetical protein [bacterium]MDW8087005.1 hypothetical protein [Candidatus Calescibacterium sp.]
MIFLRSPAKINLCLFVLGKRPDGYHDIFSIVQTVDLCDIIEIYESNRNQVEFHSAWDIPQDNTVLKTIQYVSDVTHKFYRVKVIKNIPPGAGLGGASSNAGVIIRELLGNTDRNAILIAEKIGSDVPLFLRQTPSVISGRGENVQEIKIEKIDSVFFVIVFPQITSVTRDVYAEFDRIYIENKDLQNRSLEKIEHLQKLILKEGYIRWDDFIEFLGSNDLEVPFLKLYPKGLEIKEYLLKFGNFYLTGSGSSFFALFFDQDEALKIYNKLKERFHFSWLVRKF